MNKRLIINVLIVMFLSEIILQVNELAGFVCYTLLLTGILLALVNVEKIDDPSRLVMILMIFPMIRILELFLHLGDYWRISVIYYLFLFLVLYYFIKFKFEYKPNRKGFWLVIMSVFLGLLLGYLGREAFSASIEKSLLFITIIPIVVLTEELFFRGMVQELITKNYGISYGIILTAIFYAIASLGFGLSLVLFFVLLSLILSIIYGMTKNLWLVMIINAIVHVFMFVL